jgi:hypothetical protein
MPIGFRIFITLLLLALVVTFAWQGLQHLRRPVSAASARVATGSAESSAAQPASAKLDAIPWQRDAMISLQSAIRDAQSGNLSGAEMDVDRASSIVEAARLQLSPAAPDFFSSSIEQLDRVVASHPDNQRLVEHARLVCIDLAELRSALAGPAPAVPAAGSPAALATAFDSSRSNSDSAPAATSGASDHHVMLGAPRSIAAGQVFSPTTFGGDYVDASSMPSSSELLEPPSTRVFVDNIRVENLTFQGAAQTLDGIHWHNVVFIGTRLRYQGGEVDLQNVHFVRCSFGFTTDERGARLANAIALGQSSFVFE